MCKFKQVIRGCDVSCASVAYGSLRTGDPSSKRGNPHKQRGETKHVLSLKYMNKYLLVLFF